jgi:branched-chain amino acid transport system ATP-binding protein
MRLEIKDLHVHYGKIEAIKGVSIVVNEGEIVTLIGANGAGKTTILKTISGLRPVTSGQIIFNGEDISNVPAHKRVDLGLSQAPEGRGIFPGMTVLENLEMGKFHRHDRKNEMDEDLDKVYTSVPTFKGARLTSRRNFIWWRTTDARNWPCTNGSSKSTSPR